MKFKTLELSAVRLQLSVGKNGKKKDNWEDIQKARKGNLSFTHYAIDHQITVYLPSLYFSQHIFFV